MKTLHGLVIVVFSFSTVYGEGFSFPNLPKNGQQINDFIPKGWFLTDSTSGDLNRDNLADIALVFQLKDTVDEQRPDSQALHSNPRILVILFKNQSSYDLALQNNTFMLRYGEGGMDPDPQGTIKIENGLFNIDFQFLRGHSNYKFRFQSNSFCLIGASKNAVVGGTFDGWDFDFITKKAAHSWGPIGDDFKTDNESKKIETDQLKKLSEMKMPFMWEVFPEVYL
jgi:hypothetical protein